LPPSNFHCFGDWLNIEADTPKEVIFVAYFAYATKIMAQAAHVLGKSDDVEKYTALFKKIKNVFNRIYIQPDGRIRGDTQTAYVLALAFDLVEGDAAMRAANHLISNIESRDWHLSTGFIGTKDLMLVLSKIGCKDIAYRLLLNDTFPSWGFSIKQGATSIWERWDGWTPEKGFQDPGMNSFAHYSFGAVYQWMVENIGGIRLEEPGYKKFIIAPQFSKNLNAAKTSYHSIHGVIETDWQKGKDELKLRVRVPVNTTARIVIPVASADLITESGKRLTRAEGVRFMRMDRENVELQAGSGEYSFTINARIK
jgi:alpha-L-rhamnosidase